MSEFKRIPPEQAQALREQGAVVVDIRDQPTYAAAHISGAQHLDLSGCGLRELPEHQRIGGAVALGRRGQEDHGGAACRRQR